MKKVVLLIVCVLVFGTAESVGRIERLANDRSSGLYVRSIEQVLRLDPQEVDLATAALLVSQQWSNVVNGRRYLSRLDEMAYEIRDRLKRKRLGASYRAIGVINEYLFDELEFKAVSEANDPNDLFLHSVMDERQGYCLSLSMLYLSLGERLGLPLHGVVVPGHFFVRYDDGNIRFNIETTSKGGNASDEHYIEKFKVPEQANGIYMENLNKIQTLGCLFNNMGNTYNDIGDTKSALLALKRAVEINPSLAESRTNLGNIYLKEGKTRKAIREYKIALKINPDEAKTHNNLGNAYARLDWYRDAISRYREALGLDPDFIDAYKNLANTYRELEMFGQAILQLQEAINLAPEDESLYSQSGDVYRQQDKPKEAIRQYENALRINENFADAHYGLGVCYNKIGLLEYEIEAYKKALAIKPDMVAALANLGNAYFAQLEYEEAIEQYKAAIRIQPDDGVIHYNLGAAYSNLKDPEQAEVEYQLAVELEPTMADAHKGLAFVLYKLKKYKLAWYHINRADQLGAEIDKKLLASIEDKLR